MSGELIFCSVSFEPLNSRNYNCVKYHFSFFILTIKILKEYLKINPRAFDQFLFTFLCRAICI